MIYTHDIECIELIVPMVDVGMIKFLPGYPSHARCKIVSNYIYAHLAKQLEGSLCAT